MGRGANDLLWLDHDGFDPWITVAQARAQYPGLQRNTVYRWARCGYLPHRRGTYRKYLVNARVLGELCAKPLTRYPPVSKGQLRKPSHKRKPARI